jgi:uncharacterized protein
VKRGLWRICALWFVLIILAVGNASAVEQRVFDQAGLFTAAESAQLESKIESARFATGMDVVVSTTQDAQGKTSQAYADDFYDEHGFGTGQEYSGVLFLIDMDHREAAISTMGKMINYLTDERIDILLDQVTAHLSDGDYVGAAEAFVSLTQDFVEQGIPQPAQKQRPRQLAAGQILLFLGIAVLAGAVTVGSVVLHYRTKAQKNNYPYLENSQLQLNISNDIFENRFITSRRIPQNNGGGSSGGSGGSTTHTSSSGRSHGGGSRGF